MLKLVITQVDCFCCAHLLCECNRHDCKCAVYTGGLGSIGLGSLGTFSGLNRPTPAVKTAADRAAEAAARIPDPQPGTPRQKKKAVSFVEDGQLACVRYFLKVSPAPLLQDFAACCTKGKGDQRIHHAYVTLATMFGIV